MELVDQIGDDGQHVTNELQALKATAVKINRDSDGTEDTVWLCGDVPLSEGGGILVGKPEILDGEVVQKLTRRESDLEAAEFCRLFHVLAHSRMNSARIKLLEPKIRVELDA